MLRSRVPADMVDMVELRPLQIEDLSVVRYVHASSLRLLGVQSYSQDEIDAFADLVHSVAYGDSLLEHDVQVAWLLGEIVGTSGWCPANDTGRMARITDLFVRPLFTRTGLGTLLLQRAEERAVKAGFRELSARVTSNAARFFGKRGYETTSYGVRPSPSGVDLPVVFMRKPVHVAADRANVLDFVARERPSA